MRSSFAVQTGLKLVRSPNAREVAKRRWVALGAGLAALALAGMVAGALITPRGDLGNAPGHTGPFSYFPSE